MPLGGSGLIVGWVELPASTCLVGARGAPTTLELVVHVTNMAALRLLCHRLAASVW